jgi:hypothetical protein
MFDHFQSHGLDFQSLLRRGLYSLRPERLRSGPHGFELSIAGFEFARLSLGTPFDVAQDMLGVFARERLILVAALPR